MSNTQGIVWFGQNKSPGRCKCGLIWRRPQKFDTILFGCPGLVDRPRPLARTGINPEIMGADEGFDCTNTTRRAATHCIHILSEINWKPVRRFIADARTLFQCYTKSWCAWWHTKSSRSAENAHRKWQEYQTRGRFDRRIYVELDTGHCGGKFDTVIFRNHRQHYPI